MLSYLLLTFQLSFLLFEPFFLVAFLWFYLRLAFEVIDMFLISYIWISDH